MKEKKRAAGLQEVQWTKEIPPKPPSRNLYNKQAEQLREKPGKWALIAQCPSKVAAYGAGHARKKKWGDQFEIAVRGQEVYARFTDGDDKKPSVKTHRAAAKRTSKVSKPKRRAKKRSPKVVEQQAATTETATE
jgi:hypothetical protein